MAIKEIVATRGWEDFRKVEGRLLERLSQTVQQVIATGGGVVTTASNINTMRTSGKVVWLRSSPAVIAKRMSADSNTAGQRPPLYGDDSFAEIEEVLKERLPLYEQAMHFSVETDVFSSQEVANRILTWFETELQLGS